MRPIVPGEIGSVGNMFFLYHGERIGVGIILAVSATLALLVAQGQTQIVWDAFIHGFVFYGIIMVSGLLLRCRGWLPRTSLTLVAVGFFPIFSSVMALTGYMMFPLQRPLVDETLFAIDHALGYDWVAAVTWLADYPLLSTVLKYVYLSALPQLLILLIVLGVQGRVIALHRMVVTGMVAGCLMTAFWTVFPSFGPSAYLDVPANVIARAGLLVTPDYGAQLMDLARNGLEQIEKHQLLGTMAFPSFHILMATLALFFARGTWLFWPYAVANTLMIPATLTHGGHHLIDMPGGVLLFVCSYAIARQMLPQTAQAGRGATSPPCPAPA